MFDRSQKEKMKACGDGRGIGLLSFTFSVVESFDNLKHVATAATGTKERV